MRLTYRVLAMGVKSTENLPLVVFTTPGFPLELLLSVLKILIHFGYRFSGVMGGVSVLQELYFC